ncbi:MAG: hypothetical protein Q7R93_01860 [bacterium]|nr:hypothetical protein [bacterium]
MEDTNPTHEKIRQYTVHIRTNHRRIKKMWRQFDRVTIASKDENVLFVGIKILEADHRVDAARKAYWWYGNNCKRLFGPAGQVITVSDSEEEVFYSPSFSCTNVQSRYLDEGTALRVVAEAKGELGIRAPKEGFAYWQLFRLKRRKKKRGLEKFGPCLLKSESGVLYYRRTLEPQVSVQGHIVVKRKVENVRLQARTLKAAYAEVIARKLRDLHKTGRRHLAQARHYERFLPQSLLPTATANEIVPTVPAL